jgi:UDP-galactopyranose mutase
MSWAGPQQIHIGKRKTYNSIHEVSYNNIIQPAQKSNLPALICFSHLRWNFVYQRPQHLMSRVAREYRVFFVEEPVGTDSAEPWLDAREVEDGVTVLVPRLPDTAAGPETAAEQRRILDRYFEDQGVTDPVLWYYTPMSLAFSDHMAASRVVYDCMDELSAFQGAPPELIERERELLRRADLVFTGGQSLFEAKRHLHAQVHAFPSSVDVAHFAAARTVAEDPEDQRPIPHPRMGFYGVIDERLDIALLDAVARMRPDWHLVMVGPVVKIDPAALPRRPNIHYLGPKVYDELPLYLAGWDVALLPFALNESTRFISPTKTPEYLAAGRPVVSTPITDVVRAYGDTGLARIAGTPEDFVRAIEAALEDAGRPESWLGAVDERLKDMSWDSTFARMKELIQCTD